MPMPGHQRRLEMRRIWEWRRPRSPERELTVESKAKVRRRVGSRQAKGLITIFNNKHDEISLQCSSMISLSRPCVCQVAVLQRVNVMTKVLMFV
ncbi:hypothetical protein MPTK1_1g01190 [Marchantia polymorpha subsp. ruderalis]|uniref:Uncharacterized protein n=2 Tax=Marchantia polymorpha TaxID=3197 RepID=A0AAF6AK85_MARPO|nr:hypothetical protein MARPO_0029s0127 [Marchantia polymorpha]BBM96855.1 hypothetical protein Mp_1g01190 [Marchantia polymorpha subsp. ruderalis]|eukprot:PTQ42627.1 hypothetical protein MARPO_0029s0127 [Marchantia polymorpha]